MLLRLDEHENYKSHQHDFHHLVPLFERLFRIQGKDRCHIHPEHESYERPSDSGERQVFGFFGKKHAYHRHAGDNSGKWK